MPGEHFCSVCERDLSKHKGTYVKLYFSNWEDEKYIVNVVCEDCRKEDEVLDTGLVALSDVAKPVETFKGSRKCSLCGERITKKERSLRVEYRYDGTELRANVCEECLEEHEHLHGIKPKKQNPTFAVSIVCASAGVCESFKKPKRNRGINCQNVVVNIDGELYCRKAHPGQVKIYRERWALPPNRRKLNEILTKMLPFFDALEESMNLDNKLRAYREVNQMREEGAEARPMTLPQVPETRKYHVVAYSLPQEVENHTPDQILEIPFFAIPITFDLWGRQIIVLEPVKEEESSTEPKEEEP